MATNNAINNTVYLTQNASTTQQIEAGFLYNIATSDTYTFTLPLTAHVGQIFSIIYTASGGTDADFTIHQNANQYIVAAGRGSTTVGIDGYVQSTNWIQYVYDTYICIEENNGWMRFGGGIGEYSAWI